MSIRLKVVLFTMTIALISVGALSFAYLSHVTAMVDASQYGKPIPSSTLAFSIEQVVWTAAILMPVLAVIAWLFSHTITRPISRIRRAVEGLSKEQYDLDLSINSNDEFADLNRSFNEMKGTLRRLSNAQFQRNLALDKHNLVTVTDLDGTISYANEKFVEISGYDVSEIVGQNHRILNSGEQDKNYWRKMYRTIAAGDIWQDEIRNCSKKGEYYWVATTIMAVTDSEGTSQNYISIRTDITERKKIEFDLIAARKKAEEGDRAKSEFLARMSHEIRTPINGVIGLTQLAQKTDLSQQQRDYLSKIISSSEILLSLVNDLLDFSKIEAKKIVLETALIDLQSVMEQSVAAVVPSDNLETLLSYDMGIPKGLFGDHLRLTQVMVNLVGNAVKFTEQGQVVASAKLLYRDAEKATVVFSVQDSGIGMNEEQLAGLFQPFHQADTSTTRKYGGTGLGLAISKQLVELMGGELQVVSKPGVGSTFSFTVSFKVCDAKGAENYTLPPGFKKRRMLVVEDNEMTLEIIKELLERFEFEVETATSGSQAIALLEERAVSSHPPFDLILMDWDMPGMNGIETTRAIRHSKKIPRSPVVIMVSANGSGHLIAQAEKEGIKNFIIKPVMPSLLFNTITNALGYSDYRSAPIPGQSQTLEKHISAIRGANILVVDDNFINQQVLTELLAHRGMNTRIANDGAESVRLVGEYDFDLIFMDIQMPLMDGLEATRKIRKIKSSEQLPIVAMTAHAMDADRGKSLAAGMNDHLTKPIDTQKLDEAIARWIPVAEEISERAMEGEKTKDTQKELIPEIDELNQTLGLSYVGGNQEFYQNLLRQFSEKYGDVADNIREDIDNNNTEEAEIKAHTVKGVAATMGAERLSDCSATLEAALRNGELSMIESALIQFEDALDKVVVPLIAHFSTNENRIEKYLSFESVKKDDAELLEMLKELSELLKEGNYRAENVLLEIETVLGSSNYADTLNEIATAIDNVEFEEARERVKRIILDLDGARA